MYDNIIFKRLRLALGTSSGRAIVVLMVLTIGTLCVSLYRLIPLDAAPGTARADVARAVGNAITSQSHGWYFFIGFVSVGGILLILSIVLWCRSKQESQLPSVVLAIVGTLIGLTGILTYSTERSGVRESARDLVRAAEGHELFMCPGLCKVSGVGRASCEVPPYFPDATTFVIAPRDSSQRHVARFATHRDIAEHIAAILEAHGLKVERSTPTERAGEDTVQLQAGAMPNR
jgi:hypothetical protein